MAGFGDFIGKAGSSAEQLFIWQVLGQIVSQLGAPYFAALGQAVAEHDPNQPLSPADAASAVMRHFIDHAAGVEQAKKSGLDPGKFDTLIALSGESLGPESLAEALRRKVIPADGVGPDVVSFTQGISESNLRDKWADTVRQLAVQWPTPEDALAALLEGQVSRPDALELYQRFGGDPQFFDMLFNTRGEAPTPTEALTLLNRGIIPEHGTGPESVSYEQSFLEGPWRNKWLAPFLALRFYYPPPRTVTAMFHKGQLTHDQAAGYLAKQGLDATLIAAYLAPGTTSATVTQKHLAKTDVLALYRDRLIAKADARAALVALHYSTHDADLELELEDTRQVAAQLRAGMTRVRTLFEAGKITEQDAIHTLVQLGQDHTLAKQTVDVWAITHANTTRTLTAAEIAGAYVYGIIDGPSAMTLLQSLGFDAFDAYVVLSVRIHGPLTDVARPASPFPPPPKPKGP